MLSLVLDSGIFVTLVWLFSYDDADIVLIHSFVILRFDPFIRDTPRFDAAWIAKVMRPLRERFPGAPVLAFL